MMLGKYENFPSNVHFVKIFQSLLNSRQAQQSVVEALKGLNRKSFRFEDISIPTFPDSEIIFEFGIAEGECFNFLDERQTSQVLGGLKAGRAVLDFFCVIRYYRCSSQKRVALKFDYYMFEVRFAAKMAEFRVFHKQGPRYITPKELVATIVNSINSGTTKHVLGEEGEKQENI